MSNKKKYIKSSSEVTGAAIGGVLGILAGPAGSVIGGAAGVLIGKGINELLERFLSSNEKLRVVSATEYSIIKIKERIDNGEKIRKDDYFEKINGRSKAEEIFEGVLIKCKCQYQEKKIKYISNIYANSVFNESIKSEDINQILDTVEKLTYRKICILKFCKENIDSTSFNIRDTDYRENYEFGSNLKLELLLQDFMDLYNIGIVERKDETTMLYFGDVHPSVMGLSNIGNIYFDLLGAKDIAEMEYQEIVNLLTT